MTTHLNLFSEEILVGVLSEDDQERLSFKYSRVWLESDSSFSISVALKLEDKTFDHIQAPRVGFYMQFFQLLLWPTLSLSCVQNSYLPVYLWISLELNGD